jgi:hypothetical protein
MIDVAVTLLILLQIKHWYVDFVDQSAEEISAKGIYGNWIGLGHSIKHGLGTLLVVLAITGVEFFTEALVVATLDFVIHYHMDWFKSRVTAIKGYTINDAKFWWWFGFDQLIHQLTYLLVTYMVFI